MAQFAALLAESVARLHGDSFDAEGAACRQPKVLSKDNRCVGDRE